jgi:putative membrane protein
MLMMFSFPLMGMWGGGMMGGYGMSGGSTLWGIGMSIVWLIVLVVGGYLVSRWLSGSGPVGSDRALEELRVAYARGDLTEEEYEQRRSKLDGE